MASEQPTPQGISAVLSSAGFEQSEELPDAGYTTGYSVRASAEPGEVIVRHAHWSTEADEAGDRKALIAYAWAITDAGWGVEHVDGELCVGMRANGPTVASEQPAAQPAELRQRSTAGRCHYLAARLAETGPGDPLAVSLALEILGGEINGITERAAQLVREWDASMQSYSEAAMFVDHQPSWLLAAVTLLWEVARG